MTLPNLYILEEMALGIEICQDYYPDVIIFVFDLFSFKTKGIELLVKMRRDEVIYNSWKVQGWGLDFSAVRRQPSWAGFGTQAGGTQIFIC